MSYMKEGFKCLPYYLEKIKTEEIKNGETKENIQKYIDKIKDSCMDFENWFYKKKGRKK